MSFLVAGVDGGQSSTRAAIADDAGRVLGTGDGPPADLVGECRDSDRQRAAITTALDAAAHAAALPPDVRLAAVVVGLTGHDDAAVSVSDFAPFAGAVGVVHDSVIAHAGALGGQAGITVLAGTGSVAVGNATVGGALVRAGGWGFFFGDEGGALGIARDAIAFAMRAADRGEPSQMGALALHFFGLSDLRAIVQAFAHGSLSRAAVAAFAAEVLALTEQVSELRSLSRDAGNLRNRAAGALAELAAALDRRLPSVPSRRISYAGGVFRNESMRRAFRRSVGDAVPSGVVTEPAAEPLNGALVLALRLARGQALPSWSAVA